MSEPRVILHQFLASHYNEKARWGLVWKGVVHTRVSYLPGLQARPIKRLSRQTQVPVLQWQNGMGEVDEVICGSAAILDALETRVPDSPLYPNDLTQREEALAIQQRFDSEVGPAVRTAVFSASIDAGTYLCDMFSQEKSKLVRTLYGVAFPVTKKVLAKRTGINPENVERSLRISEEALDFVAKASQTTGYLVGDCFTVADLACAALLAPLANLDHPDMRRAQPIPDSTGRFLDHWHDHPGIGWVRAMYRKHRG